MFIGMDAIIAYSYITKNVKLSLQPIITSGISIYTQNAKFSILETSKNENS